MKPELPFLRKNHKNDNRSEFAEFYEFAVFMNFVDFLKMAILMMAIYVKKKNIYGEFVNACDFPSKMTI